MLPRNWILAPLWFYSLYRIVYILYILKTDGFSISYIYSACGPLYAGIVLQWVVRRKQCWMMFLALYLLVVVAASTDDDATLSCPHVKIVPRWAWNVYSTITYALKKYHDRK